MKLLYVSWLVLFACSLGSCDLEPSTGQVFATGGTPPGGDSSTDTPDPLNQEWWNKELKRNYPSAFAKTQIGTYFSKYKGIKLEKVPAGSKPLDIIDEAISGLGETGAQICLYRCMDETEAREIKIDLERYQSLRPCQLSTKYLKGHLGHLGQARNLCWERQSGAPKVLIEFLLKPNAHNLLFSPRVAALGTESKSTAVMAEMALQEGQGNYVVKKNSEGFVKGYIGIKSEQGYFSLAMQANQGQISDNETKSLLSQLTQYVRAIERGSENFCSKVPSV